MNGINKNPKKLFQKKYVQKSFFCVCERERECVRERVRKSYLRFYEDILV